MITQAGGGADYEGWRKAPTARRLAGRHWTQPNAAQGCVRPREGHLKTQGPGRPQEAAVLMRRQGLAGKVVDNNNSDNEL